jgi:diacylglycerol kinase family enzyme
MTVYRYHVLLNVHSGGVAAAGLTGDLLEGAFAARGFDVTVDADADASMSERISRAREADAEVIVAAGGDGTITALAQALVGSGKILGILPLGTANLLARDLHIPLTLEPWLDALETMEPQDIDVGTINGRMFLHKVVIGVLPALAAGREHIRGEGSGAAIGFLRFLARRLERTRKIAVAVSSDARPPVAERVQALAVASNSYDEGVGMFFSRASLCDGKLTIYRLKHLTLGDMVRLTLLMLMGNWRDDEALTIEEAKNVTILSKKAALKVMLDGEVETIETPLEFGILPCALPVLAPPSAVAPSLEEVADGTAQ